jgi:hypothetical protein
MADEKMTAAYVAFPTFRAAIENMAHAVVPNRIDRSAFPGMAGGVQSQLLASLRFFGLINAEGRPTPLLHALAVKDEDARKQRLSELLRGRYADLFALDLTKTTPSELAEKMGESYGVSGDTREKAVRFLLSAATYSGIQVSPLLMKSRGPAPGSQRRRRVAATRRPPESLPDAPPPGAGVAAETGESHSIQLRSGGTLTLAATTKFFKLAPSDRTFVFELLDKLQEYERTQEVEP